MADQHEKHTMWVTFQGDPGLQDINSLLHLSLAQLRSTLTKNSIFTTLACFPPAQGDPLSCLQIEFSCRAGLDMPYRFQRFADDLLKQAGEAAPDHPVSEVLYSANFPAFRPC